MKIAFFDSGIGGLTVFREALRHFPNADYVYFADSGNAPYGNKSEWEVGQLILEAVDFLAQKDIDALVLACHTASNLMGKELRSLYDFPIFGMQSGIPELCKINDHRKILVCATDLSVNVWEKKLTNSFGNADFLSLQKLIIFAENFELNTPRVFDYLWNTFAPYDWDNYQSVILGCTHFPFFKHLIREIVPESVQILDGSLATALQLKPLVPFSDYRKAGLIEYFISKEKKEAAFFDKYLRKLSTQKTILVEQF